MGSTNQATSTKSRWRTTPTSISGGSAVFVLKDWSTGYRQGFYVQAMVRRGGGPCLVRHQDPEESCEPGYLAAWR